MRAPKPLGLITKRERRKRAVVFGMIFVGTAVVCWWLLLSGST